MPTILTRESCSAPSTSIRAFAPVRAQILDGRVVFNFDTRVACGNVFERFSMVAIERTHSRCVAPAMLRMAVEHALRSST